MQDAVGTATASTFRTVTEKTALGAFGDWLAINMPDPDHSKGEQRYVLLGLSDQQRLLIVAYAERPPRTRIISA